MQDVFGDHFSCDAIGGWLCTASRYKNYSSIGGPSLYSKADLVRYVVGFGLTTSTNNLSLLCERWVRKRRLQSVCSLCGVRQHWWLCRRRRQAGAARSCGVAAFWFRLLDQEGEVLLLNPIGFILAARKHTVAGGCLLQLVGVGAWRKSLLKTIVAKSEEVELIGDKIPHNTIISQRVFAQEAGHFAVLHGRNIDLP